MFVDFTDSKTSIEEVAQRIEAYHLLPVRTVKQQFPGLTFDELHFPVTLSDERAIVLRQPIYTSLYTGLRDRMGSAGESMVYYTGIEAGKGLWKNIQDIIKLVHGRDECIPELIRLMEFAHGRGKLQFVKLNTENTNIILRVSDSFECSSVKRRDKPYSALYRGFLAGLFSGWLGPVDATETKCIAAGDRYCEFRITPAIKIRGE